MTFSYLQVCGLVAFVNTIVPTDFQSEIAVCLCVLGGPSGPSTEKPTRYIEYRHLIGQIMLKCIMAQGLKPRLQQQALVQCDLTALSFKKEIIPNRYYRSLLHPSRRALLHSLKVVVSVRTEFFLSLVTWSTSRCTYLRETRIRSPNTRRYTAHTPLVGISLQLFPRELTAQSKTLTWGAGSGAQSPVLRENLA